MNKPKYYKIIGQIDPKKYLNFLQENKVNWSHSFNSKHNRENDFKSVSAFPLMDEFRKDNFYDDFFEISKDIRKILSDNYGEGVFYKIHFSKMNKNSKIKKHIDYGLEFSLSHRIQIPLQGDENVSFIVENKVYNPKPGVLFEINNKKNHKVIVKSSIERITLIVDYIEKPIYENFFK